LPEQNVKWQRGDATIKTAAFFRWWMSELRLACQDTLARLAPRWHRSTTLYLEGGRAVLFDDAGCTRGEFLCSVQGWAGLADELPEAFKSASEHSRRIRLVISGKLAYFRTLRFPQAAAAHLTSAVAIQLPKLLPLDASKLLVDFKPLPSTSNETLIAVDVAALRRADIEPSVERLKGWGFQIVSTHVSDSPTAERRFKFEDHGTYHHQWALRRLDRILVGIAAVLSIACASLAAAESYRGQKALELAKASTDRVAQVALQRREDLTSKLDPLAALSRLEATPNATGILWQLTTAIPPNTWITTFELKERALRITGVTPDSAQVVKMLSSAFVLNDIELKSSMSLGVGTGLDRFEITAHIREAAQ
jgi:general secretion pathway protein L